MKNMKKELYAGLGDYIRQNRLAKAAQKYKQMGLSDDMANSQAGLDDAGESAEMPDMKKMMAGADVSDVEVPDSSKAIQEAAADPGEDEEMQKWMAKQKG